MLFFVVVVVVEQFLLEIIDDTLIVDGMNIQESIPRVLKVLG